MEKRKIFDQYARSRDFKDWNDLKNCCIDFNIDIDEYIFEACDLVQQEQQKLIVDKARLNVREEVSNTDLEAYSYSMDTITISVRKNSILNPENLIK